jgi:hypothetical protein
VAKPYGTVYIITNTLNGKFYIGSTRGSLRKRLNGHGSQDTKIGRAIRATGKTHFIIEPLATAPTPRQLRLTERMWTIMTGAYHDAIGYNVLIGDLYPADVRVRLGVIHSKKWRWHQTPTTHIVLTIPKDVHLVLKKTAAWQRRSVASLITELCEIYLNDPTTQALVDQYIKDEASA